MIVRDPHITGGISAENQDGKSEHYPCCSKVRSMASISLEMFSYLQYQIQRGNKIEVEKNALHPLGFHVEIVFVISGGILK